LEVETNRDKTAEKRNKKQKGFSVVFTHTIEYAS